MNHGQAKRGHPGARKRGRGTFKQPVFGISERQGRVYNEIVPNCSSRSLHPILRGKVDPASIVLTDDWRGYDGLVEKPASFPSSNPIPNQNLLVLSLSFLMGIKRQ